MPISIFPSRKRIKRKIGCIFHFKPELRIIFSKSLPNNINWLNRIMPPIFNMRSLASIPCVCSLYCFS